MTASHLDASSGVRIIGEGPGYVDGSENGVLDILQAAADRRTASDELAAQVTDWPTRYHLSRRRANLLRPLRLGPGMRVLDVGAGTGVMARYVAEQGATVVALEGTLSRARAAAVRCEGLPEVDVVCGPLEAFDDPQGFDVVLCVGVLEYAGLDHAGFLGRLRDLTRPGGALVLAIENQLGLKYLLGYGEDHLGEPWVGVEGYPGPGGVRTFSRRHLARLLAESGLDQQRWLFPFPDYKTPGVIVADTAYEQADHEVFVDALVRWPCDGRASAPLRLCDDRRAHRVFLAGGLGPDVANSFLVVAAARAEAVSALVDQDATAWFYGNERARAWLGSKVFLAGSNGAVASAPVDGLSLAAADGWLRQERLTHQRRVAGETIEQLALAAIEDGAEAVAEVLGRWRAHLRALETPAGPVSPGGEHPFRDAATRMVLPANHLDVDLANFIVDASGALHYVDSEWVLPSGVDADMVCTRALWWFATDVVSRGVRHPWGRSTTVAELVRALALLSLTAADAEQLDRWHAAEAELQAKVTGRRPEDCLRELITLARRTQTGAEVVRELPFTELRRRLVTAEERLEELEATTATIEEHHEALLDQLDEVQSERADLLRRVHQEEDQRYALAAELQAERHLVGALREERERMSAELEKVRPAAERWGALERRLLVRVYRLFKRLRRRR